MSRPILFAFALAILVGLSGAATAASYSITVQTNSSTYIGAASITVSGQVSPAPGPNTAVFVRVINPNSVIVTASEVPVNGTTGLYSTSFAAGGSASWVNGNYVINATWGAYGPTKFALANFAWSTSPITTTTSTTSSTTSSTSTSSTSSTSTSSSSSSTSSTTSSSTSQQTSSTSSTGGGGGGIPEFPFQAIALGAITVLIAVSYLAIRRNSRSRHAGLVDRALA
jgi:hypothetical protein